MTVDFQNYSRRPLRNIFGRKSNIRPIRVALLGIGVALAGALPGSAESLDSFALIAGSTITNTGETSISGNVALYPGTAITGKETITLTNGTYHQTDGVAQQAKADLTSSYNVLFGLTGTVEANPMGGQNFGPGVHTYNTSAGLTGTLTLTGDDNDVFVIQVKGDFTTASDSAIVLQGGALAKNVYFVIGNSATLGERTAFQGTIMALTAISFNDAAKIECGAAFTQVEAITLIHNTISRCSYEVAPTDTSDELDDDASDAAKRLADAIDDFVTNHGTLPLSFTVLSLLSPEDLAIALEQISGEIGSSVAPAGLQSVDSFMSQIAADHSMSRPPAQAGAAPDTVSVMGYAAAPVEPGGSAFTSFGLSNPSPDIESWRIWSSAYGGVSEARGDADAGTHDLTIADFGLAVGFERNVTPDTMFGFGLTAGGTNFDLSDSLGSGRTAMLQAAIYAQRDIDDAYVSGALSYGAHAVHTSRTLTIAGEDRFSSDFIAQDVSGQVEAGYHMGWFTPYASIRGSLFYTPAYSEVTEEGVSTFALDYDESTAAAVRTEIGARANWSHEIEDGSINLVASAAWVHQNLSGTGQQASFQLAPDLSFSVDGATSSSDAIVYAVGADLAYDNGLSLGASLGGATSDSVTKYSGDAHLSYSW